MARQHRQPAPRSVKPASLRGRNPASPRGGKQRPAAGAGSELLYGIAPVEGALRAGRRRLERLYLKTGRPSPRLANMRELAGQLGLPVTEADAPELERLGGTATHQGVVLRCGALPPHSESQCLALARSGEALLVALDEVQDPQNLGAVVRTCAAFGAQGVVLPRHHAAPLSAVACKASAGHMESLPIYVVANLARFLANGRKKGFWVVGTSERGEVALHEYSPARPLIVVMGNEGRGLRPLVARQCDVQLAIHTTGAGGLNVASATAVLLYYLTLPR